MRTVSKTLIAALAVLALAAAPAYAQSGVQGSDNPQGGNVVGEIRGDQDSGNGGNPGIAADTPDEGGTNAGNANAAQAGNAQGEEEGGSLPFTGADLGLVAAAGAFLLAFGLGMRRLTRSPNAA